MCENQKGLSWSVICFSCFCLCRAEFKIQLVAHFLYLVLNFKSVFYIQSSIFTKSAVRTPCFKMIGYAKNLTKKLHLINSLSKSISLRTSPRNRDSCSFIFVSNNSLHFEWSFGYGRFDCHCDLGPDFKERKRQYSPE